MCKSKSHDTVSILIGVQQCLAGFTVVGLATHFRASFPAHGVGILAKFATSGLSWFRPTTSPAGSFHDRYIAGFAAVGLATLAAACVRVRGACENSFLSKQSETGSVRRGRFHSPVFRHTFVLGSVAVPRPISPSSPSSR